MDRLYKMRDGERISSNIVDNLMEILKNRKEFEENSQIAPLDFMVQLVAENTFNATLSARERANLNYEKARKTLNRPILKTEVSFVPVCFENGHNSLYIIKKTGKSSAQILFCDSLMTKEQTSDLFELLIE